MKNNFNFSKFLFRIYIICLLLFIVIKFDGSLHPLIERVRTYSVFGQHSMLRINTVLFNTIGYQLEHITEPWAMLNLMVNIFAFLPLGLFLPMSFKYMHKMPLTILASFLIILGIELCQLLTGLGSFDVDDILLNLIGSCIGYCIFYITKKRFAFANK